MKEERRATKETMADLLQRPGTVACSNTSSPISECQIQLQTLTIAPDHSSKDSLVPSTHVAIGENVFGEGPPPEKAAAPLPSSTSTTAAVAVPAQERASLASLSPPLAEVGKA